MHPAPTDNILVVAFANQIFGLDRASGQVRWEVHPQQGIGEVEIAIDDGIVIAATSQSMLFINYQSGQVYAEVKLPGENGLRRPTMIVSGGFVYVGRDGETLCMTTRGQIVWVQPFSGRAFGSVALGVPGSIRQADDVGSK